MKSKHILIIIAVTFLSFAGVLGNGFVGDDEVILVRNTFYDSPQNISRLFSNTYHTRGVNVAIGEDQDNGSGSVAYRPVLTLSYFLDHALWNDKPYGYHLTNLILHLINALLLYALLIHLFQKPGIALFTTLLFCLHPVQVEAVNNIGFRADPLSTMFVLLSIYSFVLSFDGKAVCRRGLYAFSIFAYFLSVFTKESAIVAPGLIASYVWVFHGHSIRQILKDCFRLYLPYILVAVFYLFIYFFVFPNTSLGTGLLDGMSLGDRFITVAYIQLSYIQDLCLPYMVKILPGLYAPTIGSDWIMAVVLFLVTFIAIVLGILYSQVSVIRFFLLWFLISLVPVSNIIPIANPMGHRFLYLPSIGFLVFVGVLIHQWALNPKHFQRMKSLGTIAKLSIIGLLMVYTIPLTMFWKNNYMVGKELIAYRSNHYLGYYLVGLKYTEVFRWDVAAKHFEAAEERGMEDPRIYHMLGLCYSFMDEAKAAHYFQKTISKFPTYSLGYGGYGRLLLLQGKYDQALGHLQTHVQLRPTYTAYGYLIQTHLLLSQPAEAQRVYAEAAKTDMRSSQKDSLKRFIDSAGEFTKPVDIGL